MSTDTSKPPEPSAELILNLRSRQSRSKFKSILAAFEARGIRFVHVHSLDKQSDVAALLRAIKNRSPTLLVVGGGDGTISTVLNKLVGTSIEIGILPLGTTNNFARSLELPLDIKACVDRIVTAQASPIDLGSANKRYFTNVLGIGLSARIASSITGSHKQRYGRLAYGIVGLKELLFNKPFYVKLRDIDSDLELSLETHQLIIANGRYHAGRKIAEEAKVDNRELIIFALGGRSRFTLAMHLIDFYSGRKRSIRHSSYIIGRRIIIETELAQPIELDGETHGNTPLQVEIAAQAVNIRYKESQ